MSVRALGEHDHRTPSVDVLAAQGAGGWSCSPSASFWRGLAVGLARAVVFFWLPLGYVLWQVLA